MAISKSKLQRTARDRKQEKGFFITLAIITAALIVALFLIYS
jgi:hypothetical protein